MNRLRLAILAGLLVVPALAHSGDSQRSFVIFNRTKADLLELYASPVGSKIWGADQLGNMRIGAGGKVTVNLGDAISDCSFDLMMVFADGEKVIRRADVCAVKTLIVSEHQEPELPSI